jgi:hypothetical protein
MNRTFALVLLLIFIGFSTALDAPAQEVKFDGTVSINAEDIAVGRLLELLDHATGLQSVVPDKFAARRASVHISALPLSEAVRTVLKQLGFDYVFIEANRVIITGVSQQIPLPPALPAYEITDVGAESAERESHEVLIASPPAHPPPLIYTPFGSVLDSGNPFIQLPPVPGEVWRPFFSPQTFAPPPGPAQTDLFRPISIYDASVPRPPSQP